MVGEVFLQALLKKFIDYSHIDFLVSIPCTFQNIYFQVPALAGKDNLGTSTLFFGAKYPRPIHVDVSIVLQTATHWHSGSAGSDNTRARGGSALFGPWNYVCP